MRSAPIMRSLGSQRRRASNVDMVPTTYAGPPCARLKGNAAPFARGHGPANGAIYAARPAYGEWPSLGGPRFPSRFSRFAASHFRAEGADCRLALDVGDHETEPPPEPGDSQQARARCGELAEGARPERNSEPPP